MQRPVRYHAVIATLILAGSFLVAAPADTVSALAGQRPSISAGPVITSSPASGDTYGKGEAIVVSVTFSEAVAVSGEPRVRVAVGDRDRWARYDRSSEDGATLTFAYTVRTNDRDADGISIEKNAVKLNGGSISNGYGNAAKLKHPAVGAQSAHKVDGSPQEPAEAAIAPTPTPAPTPPTISAGPVITSSPASGDAYGRGEAIVVSVTFSEAVTVTGEPRVRLTVGSRDRWARYSHSGSDGTVLFFVYRVKGSDRDEDGVSLKKNVVKLNGGSIADGDGNAAKPKHAAVGNQSGHKVDGSQKPARAAQLQRQQQQQQQVTNRAPQFASGSETRSVNENAAVGANVGGAVTATDADGDALTYAITSATSATSATHTVLSGSGPFAIDASSGQITVKSALDYENTASYVLTVTASDGKNPAAAIAVTVNVTNVDEAGSVTFGSKPVVGAAITASLSDPDGSPEGSVALSPVWQWAASGTRNGPFRDIAGATSASFTPGTDFDGAFLRASASYGDGHGTNKSASAVTVTRVNVTKPAFTTPETVSVVENTTFVVDLEATGAISAFNYAISGGADSDRFRIETGVVNNAVYNRLVFKSAPDFEDPTDAESTTPSNAAGNNEYVVRVNAAYPRGLGDASTRSVSQTITITVTNVDEDGEVTFGSDTPTVGTAFVATLSDPDGTISGLTWTWQTATARDATTWTDAAGTTSSSGVTSTYTPAADDAGKFLRASAAYTDGEGAGKSAAAVSTNAAAAADNPTQGSGNVEPSFTSGATFDAAENQTAVGTVAADDGDASDDIESYAITGGADQSKFSIVAASGVLTFKSAPDYEDPTDADTDNAYVVVVTATSGTGDRVKTATQTITVTVTNVDEAGSVTFGSKPIIGAALTATLSDPDGPPSGSVALSPSWQWAWSSTRNGSFRDISGATSASFTPGTDLDGAFLRASASYGDGHGAGKSASAVTVTRVNVTRPTFTTPATVNVVENTTFVADLVAEGSSSSFNYTLSGGVDAGLFRIETGVANNARYDRLVFKTAPDFEGAGDNEYVVGVRATYARGLGDLATRSVTQTITVTVTNVDEDGEVTFGSETPTVGTAFVATLSDPDGTISGLTWTWATATARDATTWTTAAGTTSSSGVTSTYTPAAGDAGKYLRASASYTDGHGPNKSAAAVSTNATAANPTQGSGNAEPSFTSGATFDAAENQTAVGTVAADDGDASDDIESYAISGGADQSKFSITSGGVLTFKSAPDFEDPTDAASTTPSNAAANNAYVVVVTATSGTGDRVKTATQTITVTVTNVDEAGSVTFGSKPIIGAAITASLADPDGPPSGSSALSPTWQWAASGTRNGPFRDIAGATSASFTPGTDLDGAFLRASASYGDGHGTNKSASAVTVTRVNVTKPAFTTPETVSVVENTTFVVDLEATGAISAFNYAISGGADSDRFRIETGVVNNAVYNRLVFKSAPDFEDPTDAESTTPSNAAANNEYVVRVSAAYPRGLGDATTRSVSQTITVTVTNVDEDGEVTFGSDTPTVGTAFVATLSDPDGTISGLTWAWATASARDAMTWTDAAGTTSSSGVASTYTPAPGDAGKYLRATASYTDGHGAGKSAKAVSTNATATADNPTQGSDAEISASITGPSGDRVTSLSAFTITITFGEKVKIEANDISVEEGRVTSGPTATSPDSAGLATVWTAQVTPARHDPYKTASGTTEPFNTVVTLIEAAYYTDTKATALATYTAAVDLPLGVVLTADEESWRQGGETVNGYKVNIFFTEPVKSDCGSSDTDACTLNADEVTVANGVARGPFGPGHQNGQNYVVFVQATGSQDAVLTVGADAVTAASGGEGNTSESITLSRRVPVARPSATITGPVPVGGSRRATYTSGTPDSFEVTITFNLPVNGLAAGDFDIRGATMAAPVATSPDTAGYAKVWTATVTPTALGVLSIQLRDGGASASSSMTNTVSNFYAFFTTGNAPQFSASTATLSLNENTRSTLKVIATDADTAIGDRVRYALSGADAHVFAIQGRLTGVIGVRDVDHVVTTLDYEAKSSYSFVVTATDTEGNTDSVTVTLNVTNLDEPGTVTTTSVRTGKVLPPQCPLAHGGIFCHPFVPAYALTGDALTTGLSDPDGSVSDITWSWERSTDQTTWSTISGATEASYTTTRADSDKYLRSVASYTDGHGAGKTAVGVTVNVWSVLAP